MYMIVQGLASLSMDGALTFTNAYIDSSHTVLEHHRSFILGVPEEVLYEHS